MSRRDILEPLALDAERREGRDYQRWLMDIVYMHTHTKLFDILHGMEFVWSHPFDENRAEEGVSLRFRFTQNALESAGRNRHGHSYRASMDDIPCSVAEMLIALAISMEDSILYDPSKGDQTHIWFWTMLRNLNLERYSDSFFGGMSMNERRRACADVREALYVFMRRGYDRHGNGGLFPLRNSRIDQRDEELWYQANVYAIEELEL